MYQNMMDTIGFVSQFDPEVGQAMNEELGRQRRNLELIASENLVSPAVMAAMGSALTNKYAEGLPHKRYYGGCEYVDVVEEIAIERACKLFGAKYANVQPHSGAQANTAVYFALLQPGDTVMGMSLAHGGHLTHGSPVNISGKYFNFVPYELGDDEYIDYDRAEALAKEVKPKLIVAGRKRISPHHRLQASVRDRKVCGRISDGRHGAHRRSGCRRRSPRLRCRMLTSPPPPPIRPSVDREAV